MASQLAFLQNTDFHPLDASLMLHSVEKKLSLNKEVNAESSHWCKRHRSSSHFSPPLPSSPSCTSTLLLSGFWDKLSVQYQFQKKIKQFWLSNQFYPPVQHEDKCIRIHTNTQVPADTDINPGKMWHRGALIKHTSKVIKRSCGMVAIIS